MCRILAYRVTKEYKPYGWTGFYTIEYQGIHDYNWHRIDFYSKDLTDAQRTALELADIYKVNAYDLGGYQITEKQF